MNNSLTIAATQPATMTSLEMVDFINEDRKERAHAIGAPFPGHGFPGLEHKNFLAKVVEVLGETSAKFSADLPDSYGRPRRGYRFANREACLMAMSYSYELQAKVFDRMTELEEAQKKPAVALPDFTNPAEAARAWAVEFEEKQKAHEALAIAAPKVPFFDKVVERDTLMSATQVAQKLGLSAVALNKHLDALDVYSKNIKRARVFKQWFVDKGYGELKQTELGHSQPLFTTSGEAWIIERMVSEGYSVSLQNV